MKNKKLLAKLIFVIVLLAIIAYTFRDLAGPIIEQLRKTTLVVIVLVCLFSVVYHLIEAWITWSLARRYNPEIKYRRAVGCAFYCSFYRLATLGSGAGVAAVFFLGKSGVGYSNGVGLYTLQYVMHKVSIALFSGVLFLINWKFMVHNYSDYSIYLFLAYGLTVLIAVGLLVLLLSTKAHALIVKLVKVFNRSGKLDKTVKKVERSCEIIGTSVSELLHDKKVIVGMIFKNFIKVCFWYCIPFIVLYESGLLTLLESLAVSSLSVMTAAVIPTPAGIGALEFLMTALFGLIVGMDRGGAITLIYRFATFVFPFLVGAVYILVTKTGARPMEAEEHIHNSEHS